MNLDHLLIKLFLTDTQSYHRFFKYIGKKYNNIYTKLYHTLRSLKEDGKSTHSVEELLLKFYTLYPVVSAPEAEALQDISNNVSTLQVSPEQASELLAKLRERHVAEAVAIRAVEVASGDGSLQDISALLEGEELIPTEQENEFVSDDIVQIKDSHLREPPFEFRLKTLNKILGGLRRKTFGFIFARPETGKTHFLVSEATFLAPQCKNGILWINNEEDGTALIIRAYQAALGKSSHEIFRHAESSRDAYNTKIGGRIKIYDRPAASTGDIELVVRQFRPDIIFIDQLDKVRGVKAERNDLILKALYQWARELAKKYNCAVVGICQAGGTAENKRFLDMNDVDSSHTAKQGEADWMFGLGKIDRESEADRRFISVCKNKLPDSPNMDSKMRHAKVAIRALPEIQIYEDLI